MLTNYDVTAIIAVCALFLSLGFWITLKKAWLPGLKDDIIKEAPEIGKRTYDLIKQDLPDIKELFKKELPEVIKAFKREIPTVDSFIEEITDRVTDPKDEKMPVLLSAMAFQGMAAFRACMQDADFKKEVDDYINGKMNYVRNQLEKSLPGILVKAAPEIKKAFLSGGGGGKDGGFDMMEMMQGLMGGGMFGGE